MIRKTKKNKKLFELREKRKVWFLQVSKNEPK